MRKKVGKSVFNTRRLGKALRFRANGLYWAVWTDKSIERCRLEHPPTESAVLFIKCINE